VKAIEVFEELVRELSCGELGHFESDESQYLNLWAEDRTKEI